MLKDSRAYSGFAVDDLEKAERFYSETLGVETELIDAENGLMTLHLGGDRPTLVYRKPDFEPATYTVLNFPVDDVEGVVDALSSQGVEFERYEQFEQDERGIVSEEGAPRVAWFRDPAGNILSILEES